MDAFDFINTIIDYKKGKDIQIDWKMSDKKVKEDTQKEWEMWEKKVEEPAKNRRHSRRVYNKGNVFKGVKI